LDWDGESPGGAHKQTLQMFTAGQVDPAKTMGQNPSSDFQFLVLKAVSLLTEEN